MYYSTDICKCTKPKGGMYTVLCHTWCLLVLLDKTFRLKLNIGGTQIPVHQISQKETSVFPSLAGSSVSKWKTANTDCVPPSSRVVLTAIEPDLASPPLSQRKAALLQTLVPWITARTRGAGVHSGGCCPRHNANGHKGSFWIETQTKQQQRTQAVSAPKESSEQSGLHCMFVVVAQREF